ncbi:MAG: hypothetical protein ACKVU1_05190 [bacterium]
MRLSRAAVLAGALCGATTIGCASAAPELSRAPASSVTRAPRLVERVREFLALRAEGRVDSARTFLASDARIWYESRAGAGSPWTLSGGAWHTWDTFFRGTRDYRGWRQTGREVSVVAVEQNDFYRLIDRPPSPVSLTWSFDEDAKLTGFLVKSMRKQSAPDRLDEFAAWARSNIPDELAYLMPDGEIAPDGDRPGRWKTALIAWRAAAGLPPRE